MSDFNPGPDNNEISRREDELRRRMEKLDALEAEISAREKAIRAKEERRKQVLLRLPESLWSDIAKWAEDDFRSINSQIEYLLTMCVKERRR